MAGLRKQKTDKYKCERKVEDEKPDKPNYQMNKPGKGEERGHRCYSAYLWHFVVMQKEVMLCEANQVTEECKTLLPLPQRKIKVPKVEPRQEPGKKTGVCPQVRTDPMMDRRTNR